MIINIHFFIIFVTCIILYFLKYIISEKFKILSWVRTEEVKYKFYAFIWFDKTCDVSIFTIVVL